jgi:tripartite-type tricarboxylate transporter receptor subunit TctC
VLERLHGDIVRVLKEPEVRKVFVGDGATPVGSAPEEFAKFLKADLDKWARVVKAAGVKAE